jgi:sialic acid synthase SpsE
MTSDMPNSFCNIALPTPSPDVQQAAVVIGDAPIGPGRRTYVIAEVGVNHDGEPACARALIDAVAAAGADAVKFQMFRADDLVTRSAPQAAYQQRAGLRSQYELLRGLELNDGAWRDLQAQARASGLACIVTPFGLADVERLRQLGVPAIKVASTDLDNAPLLERAAATGLPLIVSTGAATSAEINGAVDLLRRLDAARRLVLFHCVSAYPTPIEAANLRAIHTLAERFAVPVGLSDHTTSTRTGAWAVAAGACILEKHVTLDKQLPGPDHAMSLLPDELAAYIAAVREVEAALGTGELGFSEIEADVRRCARKSLVAARDIPAGARLEEALVAVKRPGGGITPGRLHQVLGTRATRPIPADTVLTWDMLA